jgi:hypothetical protein
MPPVPTDVAERAAHVGVKPRAWRDARGRLQVPWEALSWRTWEPDECPNLDGVLWDRGPWFDPVGDRSIDVDATRLLREWDGPVRTAVGEVSAQNMHGGTPWADVSHVDRTWPVLDDRGVTHQVPLPNYRTGEGIVRRFGDPTGTQNDLQWVGFDLSDPARPVMWECGALRPDLRYPDFTRWRARLVVRWDLTQTWETTKTGITASRLPLVPGIPRAEEFARGYIDHAIWFSAACYSTREILWPARGTDGLCSAHPLVAGSRAVLRPDWQAKRALTPDERTLVNALRADTGKGVIVSDRTDPTRGSNLRSCMDPRVTLGDLGIYLSDFLVLNAA